MKGRVVELVFVQERNKGTMVTVMPQLHVGNVVWNSLLALGDLHDLAGGDEEEHRFAIDEPVNQPWTCDAVHACLLSGHPLHGALLSVRCIGIRAGCIARILLSAARPQGTRPA